MTNLDTNNDRTPRELFLLARQAADPEQQAQLLDQHCGGDVDLRNQVQTMLRVVATQHFGPLDKIEAALGPPGESFDPAAMGRDIDDDSMVGRYKLLEQIGEGGMGVVFMAQQSEPIRRRVALKIIKPGMDSGPVIARFEAERQALAMMDHANVACVLDAGTTQGGRPYFVMELIRGFPITDYCDREKLSVNDRLKLFTDVCHGVQHAHLKGIIHRDLKPSNVMVTLHDGMPVVKIIDFGIAKAINQDLTDRTLFTQYSQMIGTPMYMSPEQAEMSGLDVDTRSDVYSLGVLLYELITGTTPFNRETLKRIGPDEMRRMIREDDPARPSNAISTLKAGAVSTLSTNRGTDPRKLSDTLRGELDWIILRAMEKDRRRRYQAAGDLADDIGRFLIGDPIEAAPPSAIYSLKKSISRHRTLVGTVAAALLMFATATIVSLNFAIQADRAKREVQNSEAIAKQEAAKALSAQARAEMNFEAALDAVDKLLQQAANSELAKIPQIGPIRQRILEDALAFYESFTPVVGDSPELRFRAAMAKRTLIQHLASDFENREAYVNSLKPVIESLRRLTEEFPQREDYRYSYALSLSMLASAVPDASSKVEHLREAQSELEILSKREGPNLYGFKKQVLVNKLKIARFTGERLEEVYQESKLLPDDALGYDFRVQLVSTLAMRLHNTDQLRSDRLLDETMDLVNQSTASTPNKADRYACANALERITMIVRSADRARKFNSRALDLTTDLVNDFPGQQNIRRMLENLILQKVKLAPKDKPTGEIVGKLRARFAGTVAIEVLDSEWPTYLWRRGEVYTDRGDYELALADLNRVIQLSETQNTEALRHAYRCRGQLFHKMGEFEKAIDDFTEYLSRWQHSYIYKRRAAAHFAAGNFDSALSDLNVTVTGNPDGTTTLFWIDPKLVAECPEPEFKTCLLQIADRVVELNNGSTESLLKKGMLLAALGKPERANETFERALSQQPEPAEANDAAWHMVTSPNTELIVANHAAKLAESAVSQSPASASYWKTLGLAQYRVEEFESAIESLEKSEELSEGEYSGLNGILLAMAHAQLGEKEKARQLFDRTTESSESSEFRSEAEQLFKTLKISK